MRDHGIIVTAADRRYYPALANLIGSIHYWAPECNIHVYDLGLTHEQKVAVQCWQRVSVSSYRPDGSLPHLLDVTKFAWKPLVIKDALEHNQVALWLDAGNEVRAPLNPFWDLLSAHGYVLLQGQDNDMTRFAHNQCFVRQKLDKNVYVGKPSFCAGVQGYVRGSPAYDQILIPLTQRVLDPECVAPSGATLANHRYDQTCLSILAHDSPLCIRCHNKLISAAADQFSCDPRHRSGPIIYTVRGGSRAFIDFLKWRFGR